MDKKINLIIKKAGKWFYLCSTNQSKTCKEAVRKFIAKHNKTYYKGSCGTWYINDNVIGRFDHK